MRTRKSVAYDITTYLRTLFSVELSFVPFPDEPPVVYMPADQWEDLTIRRQKYKAVDLGKQGEQSKEFTRSSVKTRPWMSWKCR